MIDSINYKQEDIEHIDIQKLTALGIKCYKIKLYQNGTIIYGDVKKVECGLVSTGYSFWYKNICFQYFESLKTINILTNTHKVLNKQDILLSDINAYIDRVGKIVYKILGIPYTELNVSRIDFYVDIQLDKAVIDRYIHLLKKHRNRYRYMKSTKDYETSIYLTSKQGKTTINIYDKYTCEKDKYNKGYDKYIKKHPKHLISLDDYKKIYKPTYDRYKGILRVEVQNQKKMINSVSQNIQKDIDNGEIPESAMVINKLDKKLWGYWNKESMQEYYFDLLKDFLYEGNYYKRDKANEIIDTFYGNNEKWKKKLKDFLFYVSRYGVTGVIKSKDNKVRHRTWAENTVKGYIEKLTPLNINPITIDDNADYDTLESLQTLIKKTAKKKYFDIDNVDIMESAPRTNDKPKLEMRTLCTKF